MLAQNRKKMLSAVHVHLAANVNYMQLAHIAINVATSLFICSHDVLAIQPAVMLAVVWRTPRWYHCIVAPPLQGHTYSPLE